MHSGCWNNNVYAASYHSILMCMCCACDYDSNMCSCSMITPSTGDLAIYSHCTPTHTYMYVTFTYMYVTFTECSFALFSHSSVLGQAQGQAYTACHSRNRLHVLMRDERRKEERGKQDQTYNKAKQHSTPKAVTLPKKNELPQVGLEPMTRTCIHCKEFKRCRTPRRFNFFAHDTCPS